MIHWIKFNVVGLLGFALQSGALFLLTHAAPQLSYLVATAIAVELAVLHNFVWHQRWTWRDRPSATTGETIFRLVKFNILSTGTSLAAGTTNSSIDNVTRNKFSAEQKLFSNFNVTTSVTDLGSAAPNKSITAGFKLKW